MFSNEMTAMAAAGLGAFIIAAATGKLLIPWLHKLKFGQTIREIGPSWHKKKQGTPTMGGLLFIIGSVIALAAAVTVCALVPELGLIKLSAAELPRMFGGFAMALCCGAIGFADDYIKVVKKRNLGLTAPQKMFAQLLVAAGYGLLLYVTGSTRIGVPFYGELDLGIWIFPFSALVLLAMTNAVNFTDGVDGLCGTVSFAVALFFIVLAGIENYFVQGLQAAALAGGLAGFLVWNLHPARVFMGDIGSLYIGGLITAVAFGVGQPLLLLPAGIIYVAEMLSVVLQVLYFKSTGGKRLFKMSPIHHHFEMSGWSETKIVAVFTAITLAGCLLAGFIA